jgi:hypothetical protein
VSQAPKRCHIVPGSSVHHPPTVLRPFRDDEDIVSVRSVASDQLVSLITTVQASGDPDDARAYIERQHQRLALRQGYSFASADAATGMPSARSACGSRTISKGRASTGCRMPGQFRRRGYVTAALVAISRCGRRPHGSSRTTSGSDNSMPAGFGYARRGVNHIEHVPERLPRRTVALTRTRKPASAARTP